jgi:hypothetical protein
MEPAHVIDAADRGPSLHGKPGRKLDLFSQIYPLVGVLQLPELPASLFGALSDGEIIIAFRVADELAATATVQEKRGVMIIAELNMIKVSQR